MVYDDYIVRMFRQGAIILARIIGFKKSGDYEEALQEIDQALGQLLKLSGGMIKILDNESIYKLLTIDDQLDIDRLGMIADLYREEAEIFEKQGKLIESKNSYLRSLGFYITKYSNEEPAQQINTSSIINQILNHINEKDLPSETLLSIFCYYENTKEFNKAEKVILLLRNIPEYSNDARNELISFYKRLLEMKPEDIQASGLTFDYIREKLKLIE